MIVIFLIFAVQFGPILSAPHINDVISSVIDSGTSGCPQGSACVAFNLCKDDGVVKDGGGLMDIRFDDDEAPGECVNYYEICCRVYDEIDANTVATSAAPAFESCGVRNMDDDIKLKITGGKDSETRFGEFPWMMAILTEESIDDQIELNVYQCGGSLIHPKVVMTAAHCVFSRLAKSLKVRGGEWDTQTKSEALPHQDRFVTDIKIHEKFNRHTLHNDVALLILSAPFELTVNVRTVCLPPANMDFDEAGCIATGWGKDSYGKIGKYSNILKKVDLPIVARGVCEASLRTTRLGAYFQLHRSFVCAGGEQGKDTCKGDGGSPLICPVVDRPGRYYQAGIVAWGIGCGGNIPAVYAGVSQAREWVDKQFVHFGFECKYYVI